MSLLQSSFMALAQVSFHPEKDVTLMDVTNDAILVVHASLRDSPSLRFASLLGDDQTVTPWPTAPPSTTERSVCALLEGQCDNIGRFIAVWETF